MQSCKLCGNNSLRNNKLKINTKGICVECCKKIYYVDHKIDKDFYRSK